MDTKKFKVVHFRTEDTNNVDLYDVENYAVEGKRPEPEDVEYGELIINYSSDDEMLMIKNNKSSKGGEEDKDEIVAFINEKYFNDNIGILMNALVNLDSKIDTVRDYHIERKVDELVMPVTTNIEKVTARALSYLNDRITPLGDVIYGGEY